MEALSSVQAKTRVSLSSHYLKFYYQRVAGYVKKKLVCFNYKDKPPFLDVATVDIT